MWQGISLKSERNNPWFNILLHTQSIVCACHSIRSMFRVLGIYNFGWGWKCSTPSIASPCHTLVFTGDKVERKELWLERQEILWTYFLLLVAAVLNKILFVKFTATYFRIFNTSFVLMLSIHTQLAKYWIMILFKNVLIFTLTKRIQ